MVPCHCKNGKMTIKVSEYGVPGEQAIEITCIDCRGTGQLTEHQAAVIEASKHIWCQCPIEDCRSIFHPDSPGVKHHWTCTTCGKVTQIG